MMVYVYAISDRGGLPGISGLHGSRLFSVPADGLYAIASEHQRKPESNEDAIWSHESVVEAAMAIGTVLPMRFGTLVLDASQLQRTVRARREEFEAALLRVRGAVELSVRAQLGASATQPDQLDAAGAGADLPGTAYLQRRLEEEQRSGQAADLIHAPLASLAREARQRTPAAPGTLKAAYLVDRERVDEFGERVGELSRELDGTAIACTGPWPPYSFVEGAAQ
ncbi:MAG: GvpL/GvpF family gas vesicle protein [Solirubrobacterales bacterium]